MYLYSTLYSAPNSPALFWILSTTEIGDILLQDPVVHAKFIVSDILFPFFFYVFASIC